MATPSALIHGVKLPRCGARAAHKTFALIRQILYNYQHAPDSLPITDSFFLHSYNDLLFLSQKRKEPFLLYYICSSSGPLGSLGVTHKKGFEKKKWKWSDSAESVKVTVTQTYCKIYSLSQGALQPPENGRISKIPFPSTHWHCLLLLLKSC